MNSYPELKTLPMDVEQSVQEQDLRHSWCCIQHILYQGDWHVVDKLIQIVRIADLSPLTNTLSPQARASMPIFLASR